jgi:hypothetical protein
MSDSEIAAAGDAEEELEAPRRLLFVLAIYGYRNKRYVS